MPIYRITYKIATHDTDGYELVADTIHAMNKEAAYRELGRRAKEMVNRVHTGGGVGNTRDLCVELIREDS